MSQSQEPRHARRRGKKHRGKLQKWLGTDAYRTLKKSAGTIVVAGGIILFLLFIFQRAMEFAP